jgi:hypothetical protein
VPLLNEDATSLTGISGYRVNYGTSPTNLPQSVTVTGAGITSSAITGLAPGTYYFRVTTLKSTGETSDPSNAVSKTVP